MTTKRLSLDSIDRTILRDLQADGRMTNVDLARNAGITAPPCLRRVRALEEGGYIRGYHAELNPTLMGYSVTVFANVSLASQSEADLARFQERVEGWPEVRECYMLAGEPDFILKIVAKNWDDYQRFLTTKLTGAPGISNIRSSMVVRVSKYQPGVPVDIEVTDEV